MTDVSCPVCGRPNTHTNDSCDFCGADLSRTDASQGELPTPESTEPSSDSQPDGDPLFEIPDIPEESGDEQAGWLDLLQDDEPEILSDLESAPSTSEPEKPPSREPEEKKPQTDWLERIKRLDDSSDQVDDDSSFPDWLAVAGDPEPAEEESIPESEPPQEEESIPDWLQMDDEDELLNQFLKQKASQETQAEQPAVPDSEPDQAEPESSPSPKFPSWASQADRDAAEEVPEDLQFLAGAESERSSAADDAVDPFQMEEDDYLDDLFEEELPGWLTEASDTQDPLRAGEDISQGELPGWVEAMRPVVESAGSAGYDEEEDYLENYGPLAGIPSILPAEAEMELDHENPRQPQLDLTITKTQQEYISLLEKLISSEGKVKPVQVPPPVVTQRLLRWLIAIVLILTVGSSVIFGGASSFEAEPQGMASAAGAGSLYGIVNQLDDEDPVLIAFDYQPATAGEMNTASAAVIQHLMDQGTYLTLVSTQPTGPALAENFLQSSTFNNQYQSGLQYINLGYLPGEAAGLLSFVFSPKEIIPLAYNGSNAWGSPPLIGVDGLADFQLVLVITDDPHTAKIWIEQVEPFLGNTPLGMIVSAQVEPLILPYYQTVPQPLNGYTAGIIDGVQYEILNQDRSLGHAAWLPFNIGIIISVLVIFIGGLSNGILTLFTQLRRQQTGDR